MARGRDATDVAIVTSFGPRMLAGFRVFTEEVIGTYLQQTRVASSSGNDGWTDASLTGRDSSRAESEQRTADARMRAAIPWSKETAIKLAIEERNASVQLGQANQPRLDIAAWEAPARPRQRHGRAALRRPDRGQWLKRKGIDDTR